MIRDSVGHEIASGEHWKGFHVVAKVTAFHIICHIVAHPWPPKVMHKFHCFPSSRVSSYWIVMVIFDNIKPELIVSEDADLSSVEY